MYDPKGLQRDASSRDNAAAFEIDFGTRKVSHLKTSRIVAIPKQALANFISGSKEHAGRGTGTEATENEISQVNVRLVHQANGERFIKLSPIVEAAIVAPTVNGKGIRKK
jgi:hypothetical protein